MTVRVTVDSMTITVVHEGESAPGDPTGFRPFSSRTRDFTKAGGFTLSEAIDFLDSVETGKFITTREEPR